MNCVYVPLKSQNNYIGAQAEHVKIDPSTSQYFRKETENEMFWICKATAKILWRLPIRFDALSSRGKGTKWELGLEERRLFQVNFKVV